MSHYRLRRFRSVVCHLKGDIKLVSVCPRERKQFSVLPGCTWNSGGNYFTINPDCVTIKVVTKFRAYSRSLVDFSMINQQYFLIKTLFNFFCLKLDIKMTFEVRK